MGKDGRYAESLFCLCLLLLGKYDHRGETGKLWEGGFRRLEALDCSSVDGACHVTDSGVDDKLS